MDERELVQRCQRRDYAAFELLYQLHIRRALRTAFLVTRNRAAAEDAVQEAFIQVWRRIESLRDAGAFRSWFYRILLNATHRLGRKEPKVLPLNLGDHDRPDLNALLPDEYLERGEEVRELRLALVALSEMHRIPLVLRYYSRLSDAEIAEVLQVPVGTVKSRLHAARDAVERHLVAGPTQPGKERHLHG